MSALIIIGVVLAGVAIFLIGWVASNKIGQGKIASAKQLAAKIIEDTKKESETLKKERILEARDEVHRIKQKVEEEVRQKTEVLKQEEKRLKQRDENIHRRMDLLEKKERSLLDNERDLEQREKILVAKEENLTDLLEKENKMLERIAHITADEAVNQLKVNLLDQAKAEVAVEVKEIKDRARQLADKEAKEIVVSAIQRTAADHSVETTVSVVNLPNNEIKGRIIGREGRNIRSFEMATGIELIVDDTPEAVILSGFDPYRREIAKVALEKLILNGRIHPGRIEEVVEKTKKEMEESLVDVGEQAMLETGVHGLHQELVKLLGKLKYRTSYGQNVLQHSIEVAYLAGLIAAELQLDARLAKRAGLLHDIGKAIDKYTEGTHTQIGVDMSRKYGENKIIQNAIAAHHEDVEPTSLVSILVQAADAISGSRPGARRETVEGYVKRLEKLEQLAESFSGVSKTYAIQAGREIRVMVENEEVDDAQAEQLAHDIATKIKEEMEYPGQIRVTVIREFRAIDYAK
ncbi:ribonuclease Y [candidate division KSB1 bacterium]|nr:ribonuclease Y [candidate division KSB1 bacterium]